MPLTSAFTVSASTPFASGYDASNPTAEYANAWLYSYGGVTFPWSPNLLTDQAANDELLVGYGATDPTDEADITSLGDQIYTRAVVHLALALHNIDGDEQVLLVYGLKQSASGACVAQFFVGSEFVRSEPIDDPTETVALLIDVPNAGYSWLNVYLRVAGAAAGEYWARAFVTGVEGFIL